MWHFAILNRNWITRLQCVTPHGNGILMSHGTCMWHFASFKRNWIMSRECVIPHSRVLQCVAVCCSVLQCVAVLLQCVAVCYSVLQCVAVRCSVLQCVAVCYSVLQCVAVCCSVLQCVAVCWSDEFLDQMRSYIIYIRRVESMNADIVCVRSVPISCVLHQFLYRVC